MNNEVNDNPNTNNDNVNNNNNNLNNTQQPQNSNITLNNIDNPSNINNTNNSVNNNLNTPPTPMPSTENATTTNDNITNIETPTNSNNNNQPQNNSIEQNNSQKIKSPKKISPIVIILIVIGFLVLGYIVFTTIIMAVAGHTVKNAMDKNRLSSTSDASKSIATSINLKISEEEIMGNISQVYSSELQNGTGYNLETINGEKVSNSNPAIYYISNDLDYTLLLPNGKFILSDDSNLEVNPNDKINTSFFTYDSNVVNVCLVVGEKSDYYSKGAVIKQDKEITLNNNINITFKKGTMYSCSDGQNSWE